MAERTRKLTRNQGLVHDVLDRAGGPLSAYAILDQLRGEGLRAPLQVYRALEKLLEFGLAHRLESLNAYVACSHRHRPGGIAVFAICDDCGEVSEFQDEQVRDRLAEQAESRRFTLDHATVELHGLCRDCAEDAA
ncbi:Fur family transcriptional regulator [Minwuia thermotolerans]|nr:Fur family transcriptional regulator [Minwuia thermotolerans]ANK83276.1 MAG: Fur family transcriptional regulator [Rhizobiales bacterium NRL2]